MNKLFVSVLSFVLAFAGFADSGVTPATSNLVKKLSWCSLGTSITALGDSPVNNGEGRVRTHGYQYYTMQRLGWDYTKHLNAGVSAAVVGVHNTFPTTPYDIYTIEFGVNDWARGHIIGTINDYENYLYGNAVRRGNFASSYREVIEKIRTANPSAVIVLMTPRKAYGSDSTDIYSGERTFPRTCDGLSIEGAFSEEYKFWDPEDNQYHWAATKLEDYAVLIRQIAEKEGFVLCDWYEGAATEGNLASLSVDVAIHPNDEGYEIMAEMLAPKILEAIQGVDFCANGHRWGEWEVTKDATTTERGLRKHTCERCDKVEAEEIPMVATLAALRNVAVATAVGVEPELPAKVAGILGNGTIEGEYEVDWDAPETPIKEGITTVNGTANIGGQSMSVTAFVRAVNVESGSSELVNIAQRASSMIVTAPGFGGDVGATTGITNGIPSNVPLNTWWNPLDTRWVNWNSRATTPDVNVDFTWSSAQKVSKVFLGIFDGNQEPDSIVIMSGGVNLEEEEGCTKYASNKNGYTYYKFNQSHGYLYVFATPIEISSLKVMVTMKGGVAATNIYVGFNQIEVWAEDSSGPAIEPLTANTLSTLEVDGVEVAGFAPTTYNYEVDNAEAITDATATDNMGITILPKFDGAAYVITLAEDGTSTKTYMVAMPSVCPHPSTTVEGAVAATCTEPGSTGTITCDICHEVIQEAAVIPALGHDWGEWEIKKEATEEETGLKKRTCRRDGCDAFEEEEIPLVPHTVALRNIAVAVAVGKTLTLPTTVNGLDAAGEAVADIAVTWQSAAVKYDAPGTYTVEGYATAKPAMRVKATIRAEAVEIAYKNVSTSATPTTTGGGTPKNVISPTEPGDGIDWATTNAGNMQEFVDTLTWNSPVTISSVKVCYSGSHKPPKSYAFSADASGSPEISFTQGEVETVGVHRWVEFKFNTPMTLTELRCLFVLGEGGWMIIERIWAYECEGEAEIVPSSNAALSDLKVDGETVRGFDPDVFEYRIYNGKEVSAESTDNAAITILPKDESDTAYVITLSEDGTESRMYSVEMPIADFVALRNVALPAEVGKAPVLPTSVKAFSATGEIAGEMDVAWEESPLSTKAGIYTVEGFAIDDPKLKVKAFVRAVAAEVVPASNVALAAKGGSITSVTLSDETTDLTAKAGILINGETPDEQNGALNTFTTDRKQGLDMSVTFKLSTSSYVSKVKVYSYASGNYTAPTSAEFYDDNSNQIACGEPVTTQDTSTPTRKIVEFIFAEPVKLASLKAVFKGSGYLSITEVEIWTPSSAFADLTPSSNAKPEGVMVNGALLKGFDPDVTTGWKVSGKKLSIVSEDNIAATILPKAEDQIIRVITLAEDGVTTKTYEFLYMGGFAIMIF